jgi:Zn-dependent protease/predicted transcriptional regulator
MSQASRPMPPAEAAPTAFGGVRLGRVAGVEVRADWSLFIIFAIVALSLGAQVFPAWHPDWSTGLQWFVAIVAAIAFFASIWAHEMSHALVGRWQGIPISRITLFLFGGMAHMEDQPPTPRSELLMAIVGPVTSIVIGAASIWIAWALAGPEALALMTEQPVVALSYLGPVETILLWLGPINLLLGVFNLVPGFPLDGGRVFRAVVWSVTGDIKKATLWASTGGRIVAVALMAMGVAMALGVRLPIFGTGLFAGLWLVLIGWFLHKAAQASFTQLLVREALAGVRVMDVMRRRVDTVSPDTSLAEFVEQHVMQSDQETFPVVHDGEMVGVLDVRDTMQRPAETWPTTPVRAIMRSLDAVPTVTPQSNVEEAMRELRRPSVTQIAVVDRDGGLAGVLRERDLMKWLMMRNEGLPG